MWIPGWPGRSSHFLDLLWEGVLFGAFVQVGQCCWIVGYIAFRFAVGLCVLAWLVVLLTLFGLHVCLICHTQHMLKLRCALCMVNFQHKMLTYVETALCVVYGKLPTQHVLPPTRHYVWRCYVWWTSNTTSNNPTQEYIWKCGAYGKPPNHRFTIDTSYTDTQHTFNICHV